MVGVCENPKCTKKDKQQLYLCYYCRKWVCFDCFEVKIGERVCHSCIKELDI